MLKRKLFYVLFLQKWVALESRYLFVVVAACSGLIDGQQHINVYITAQNGHEIRVLYKNYFIKYFKIPNHIDKRINRASLILLGILLTYWC